MGRKPYRKTEWHWTRLTDYCEVGNKVFLTAFNFCTGLLDKGGIEWEIRKHPEKAKFYAVFRRTLM